MGGLAQGSGSQWRTVRDAQSMLEPGTCHDCGARRNGGYFCHTCQDATRPAGQGICSDCRTKHRDAGCTDIRIWTVKEGGPNEPSVLEVASDSEGSADSAASDQAKGPGTSVAKLAKMLFGKADDEPLTAEEEKAIDANRIQRFMHKAELCTRRGTRGGRGVERAGRRRCARR